MLYEVITGVLTATIVPDVVREMKTQIFKSMGKLSISFYNNRQTGSLMTRVLSAARITSYNVCYTKLLRIYLSRTYESCTGFFLFYKKVNELPLK